MLHKIRYNKQEQQFIKYQNSFDNEDYTTKICKWKAFVLAY